MINSFNLSLASRTNSQASTVKPAATSLAPAPAPAPAATTASTSTAAMTPELNSATDPSKPTVVTVPGGTTGTQTTLAASKAGPGTLSNILNAGARLLLQKPPFAPKNVNLFSNVTYPNASAMQPAAAYSFSEQSMKNQLNGILTNRFGTNRTAIQAGLNVYNDPKVKQIAPDPRLRASLASLQGTAGQSAIDAIKAGNFSRIRFGTPITGPDTVAEVLPPPPGQTKPEIVFNDRYQFEDIRVLSTTLAHETLHSDSNISGKEELVANALQTMLYGEMVLESPSLAQQNTELIRRTNTQLMARLNTRDAQGNLRLFTANGDNVLPGAANPLPNFATAFGGGTGADTPGNNALRGQLQAVTGMYVSTPGFNTATLNLLDQNQKLLSPVDLVKLARILNLQVF